MNFETSCIKQCKLDKEAHHCVSCGRTLEEIIETGKKKQEYDRIQHQGRDCNTENL